MAIVFSVQKWWHYLLGRHFIVRTDQQSLKFLLEQCLVCEEHQKWLSKLLGFDFEIQFQPSLENKAVDAFSRMGPTVSFLEVSCPWVLELDEVRLAVARDRELSKIVANIQSGSEEKSGCSVVEGILHYKGILVLPKPSQFIEMVLQEYHNTRIGGYLGFLKTYKRIAREVYWKGIKKDVREFVGSCSVCQQNKYMSLSPQGLLQPLPILERVWANISLDFIEGLPKSEGWDTIPVAKVFIREVVRLHGIPQSIVSNRDHVFMSKFWEELFRA